MWILLWEAIHVDALCQVPRVLTYHSRRLTLACRLTDLLPSILSSSCIQMMRLAFKFAYFSLAQTVAGDDADLASILQKHLLRGAGAEAVDAVLRFHVSTLPLPNQVALLVF